MRKLIDVGGYDTEKIKIHSRCRPLQACQPCALAKSKAISHPARPIQKRSMTLTKRTPNPDFNEKDTEQQGFSAGCISTDQVGGIMASPRRPPALPPPLGRPLGARPPRPPFPAFPRPELLPRTSAI